MVAGPTSPVGKQGHQASSPPPAHPAPAAPPPQALMDLESGSRSLQRLSRPTGFLESLTFSNLSFHPSDRFIPGKLCLLLQL